VKIEVLEKDDTMIRIVVRDADVPLMNTLRRIALAEVPSMAIDEVVMIENITFLKNVHVKVNLAAIFVESH
jgi:DNA-directed RNA polymerase subunit D